MSCIRCMRRHIYHKVYSHRILAWTWHYSDLFYILFSTEILSYFELNKYCCFNATHRFGYVPLPAFALLVTRSATLERFKKLQRVIEIFSRTQSRRNNEFRLGYLGA